MEQTETQDGFEIGGVVYRLEPLSWQQNKWLGEHIFAGIDMQRLDYGTIHDLLREKGPLLMAICLIEDGQSRSQHSKLPWATVSQRAADFAAELTGEEVMLFGPRFFRYCRPGAMAMHVPGTVFRKMLEDEAARSAAPGENGSSGASSPSVTETLPSSGPSSPTGDQPSPSPISGDASSDRPSTTPSSAGVASSCPG